jgi:hypothetical protein
LYRKVSYFPYNLRFKRKSDCPNGTARFYLISAVCSEGSYTISGFFTDIIQALIDLNSG